MSAARANVITAIRERAAETPDAAALRCADPSGTRVTTYGDLVARMDQVAEGLARRGVAAHQRVGLVAPQGAGFVEGALGILAAGACVVPIPDDHSGAVLEAFATRARLHHLVQWPGGQAEPRSDRLADVAAPSAGEAAFAALDPAYLRFTSGTTSTRKGVILGHAAILARLAAANRGLEIGPGDRVLWLLPMAHHFVVSILLYLRYGACILLPGSHLAANILGFANREDATMLYASPYHYNLLGKSPGEGGLGAVRLAISTAEGLRGEIAARFAARFGLPVRQALGIIEVGLPVIDLGAAAKPGALGRPLPDYEVWLRSDAGEPVVGTGSPDHGGEVCIRGPGMFDAYLDPWLPASELLTPDGFRTGDQGWFDADGDLHLSGRRANRINMAGMKFFGEEVEAVLDAHPAVTRSHVFGREHAHLGEIPVAEFELAEGCEVPGRKEFVAHCRASLPAYKVPREFRAVEALAETVTGKIARAARPPEAP